ncbi:AAA family ATPase [Candidatus Poribacteria bacterium]|nr:AAA family ATPase [Candidatus Poribacteria bacterium]
MAKTTDIDYMLEVKPLGTDPGDPFAMRLVDARRKEPVNVALPDVSFGISQLLPFIVQSLVSEGRIISIEQPEVHVHPRLQADLGDLLVERIKKQHWNQFIIETHSEHLILRLQRRIYEKQIEPEDVSVIYVSRGPEGAKAERLRLDEDGDFIDEWPNGFSWNVFGN